MPSDADIVNDALSKVGNTAFIDSLNDPTTEAQVAALQYERRRDEVLQSSDWPFATARAQLQDLGTTRNGWRKMYLAPPDMLKPLAIPYPTLGTNGVTGTGVLADPMLFAGTPYVGIWTAYRNLRADQRIPYRIEASDDRSMKVILTDYDSPELIYVARMENPDSFPALFQNALAWRLAAEFAGALNKNAQLMRLCMDSYTHALSEAAAEAFRENREDQEPPSLILAARR